MVLVDGGNTFWLRRCMEDWLDAFRRSSAVYVGVSAGHLRGQARRHGALEGLGRSIHRRDIDDWGGVLGLDLAGGASVFHTRRPSTTGSSRRRPEARHEPLLKLDERSAFVKGDGPGRFV